jgi:hypothetical protein
MRDGASIIALSERKMIDYPGKEARLDIRFDADPDLTASDRQSGAAASRVNVANRVVIREGILV